MYICICNGITEAELRDCVAGGAGSFEELQLETGVASCCGTCAGAAQALLSGGSCPGPAACHGQAGAPVSVAAPRRVSAPVPTALPIVAAPVRWVSRVPRPSRTASPALAAAA